VDVTLQRECLVSGATEVPTDVPGTLRYDRTPESTSGLRMARSYTFDGGCVTYEFHFADRTDPLVTQASLMVGFLPRAELERRLYGPSHGRAGS
jgi:hypothetical protein